MSTQTLGVLLVSGRLTHQEMYADAFRQDPRCRLIALTDERDVPPERARWNQEFAEALGIPYLTDLDDALVRDDVHIVSVCAEPERRGRIIAQCARAGKHVYIDKPMTPYLPLADEIVQTVAQAGVRSQMFSFIHQPWAQHAREVVDSGALGDLVAIHADFLFAKGPAGTARLGQPRRPQSPPERFTFVNSKAELYAAGVYAIGLVRWISRRNVETVYGCTANYFFEAHQRNDVEDFGLLTLTLKGGLAATVTGGRIGWTSHAASGVNQVYLIGTKGVLLFDVYRPRIEVFDAAPPWMPPEINPRDPMGFWSSTQQEVNTQPKRAFVPFSGATAAKSDASHFIDCIVEGRESEMSARDAAALTEILVAGYKSAATGEVVTLPLPRT